MSESSSERDPVEEFLARCRCSQRPDLREIPTAMIRSQLANMGLDW